MLFEICGWNLKRKYWKLFELWCVPFWKNVFRKNAFKVLSWVWETPDTPQEKREIKQKFFFHVWNLLPHILEGSNWILSQKKTIFWKIYTGFDPYKIFKIHTDNSYKFEFLFLQDNVHNDYRTVFYHLLHQRMKTWKSGHKLRQSHKVVRLP